MINGANWWAREKTDRALISSWIWRVGVQKFFGLLAWKLTGKWYKSLAPRLSLALVFASPYRRVGGQFDSFVKFIATVVWNAGGILLITRNTSATLIKTKRSEKVLSWPHSSVNCYWLTTCVSPVRSRNYFYSQSSGEVVEAFQEGRRSIRPHRRQIFPIQ